MAEARPQCAELDTEMRVFWRAQLARLDTRLLEGLLCDDPDATESKGASLARLAQATRVKSWMLCVDPTLGADEELLCASFTWVKSQRSATLRMLIQRFETLRSQDTQRARDVQEAARAFQKEYEALLDASDCATL